MQEYGTVISTFEGPSTRKFSFVINKGMVRKGQFVELKTEEGRLIGRVSDIIKTNRYFMRPESVKEYESSGKGMDEIFPVADWEFLVAEVIPLGVYNGDGFQDVLFPPSPGERVVEPEGGLLQDFFGMDKNGLFLGDFANHNLEVRVNLTRLLQKHLAILALSGAGKSFLTSVLIEELLNRKPEEGIAIIIIDPHGEYSSFADDPSFSSRTKVFRSDEIRIGIPNMHPGNFAEFVPKLSSAQARQVSKVLHGMKNGNGTSEGSRHYSISDMIETVEKDENIKAATKDVIVSTLYDLAETGVFGAADYPSLEELARQGGVSVIDLSETTDMRKKQIITAFISRKLFNFRRRGIIPPFLLVLEEAHQFVPEGSAREEAISRGILNTIAREGRKFNASLCLISQRPKRLSTTILSQCVVPETGIMMEDGYQKTIGELEREWKKSKVGAVDTKKMKLTASSISAYLKTKPRPIFNVISKETGRRVTATGDHPFWVRNKGWTPLSELKIGDKVAVLPQKESIREKMKEKVIIRLADVKKQLPPTININRVVSELEGFLPLTNKNERLPALARLIGHIFGDGTLHTPYKNNEGQHSLRITFSGKREDLAEIQKDLRVLGFKADQKITEEIKTSIAVFQKYGTKKISGKTIYFKTGIVSLWALLAALGTPIGNKTNNETRIPEWLMKSPKNIKREFLSAFVGSEGQKIRMVRRACEVVHIPFSKSETIEKNGEEFHSQLSSLFSEFDIQTGGWRREYCIQKNGSKTTQFSVDIKAFRENMIAFCQNVGYRYSKEREDRSRIVLGYLEMVEKMLAEKRLLWKKSRHLGVSDPGEISEKLKIPIEEVKSLLRTKNVESLKLSYSSIPHFNDWIKDSTEGLNDGMIWETVSFIKKKNKRDVRDITVPNHHSFFANGFLTHNCNTNVILRLTNPYDLKHVEETSEGITKDVVRQISSLRVGTGFLVGEAVNFPLFIKIRKRSSKESEKGMPLERAAREYYEKVRKKRKDAKSFM